MKQFNVLTWDFNKKELSAKDVLPYFRQRYEKAKKDERPKTLSEWKEFIRRWGMYMYWSRCEYEIIVSPWPTQDKSIKIDVWYQIEQNLGIVAEMLSEETDEKN